MIRKLNFSEISYFADDIGSTFKGYFWDEGMLNTHTFIFQQVSGRERVSLVKYEYEPFFDQLYRITCKSQDKNPQKHMSPILWQLFWLKVS